MYSYPAGKLKRSISLALSLLACTSLLSAPFNFDSKAFAKSPNSDQTRISLLNKEKSDEGKSKIAGDGSGTLLAMLPGGKKLGECPLKHTDVKASVAGYVARVNVKQTFHNPYKDKIEAVYTFPLPENAAVDEMTMKIGQRVIKGNIKKKEEARQIYEQARANGQVASLLDQERANIFTQSVANIAPGETVEIEIKYVDLLPYEAGSYTFNFPTVVGPRFNPGSMSMGKSGLGRAEDTDQVPDASKITPHVAPRGERAGHDISISLDINAGMAINSVDSKLHEIQSKTQGNSSHIELVNKNTIPNRDFVLTWSVAQDKLQSGYLAHHDAQGGFFTLMMLPPKKVTTAEVAPKEMVFLVDTSGSQSGAPLDKAKETLNYIVDHMNPNDTFQIIAFSSGQEFFAPKPQPASAEMRGKAKKFIASLQANGGTWMGPAVEKVCALPNDAHRLRIVTFMTDGYVGNDMEILGMIHKYRAESRWFSFGTGNSVNRFLIDGIAKEGGGEADYVLLNSPGNEVGKKFYERIANPVLTDVKVQFDGLDVKDVYPKEVSDVWAEKPLYIKGRYLKPGAGTITLTGYASGKPYTQTLKVNFPENQPANEAIKPIWARAKVDRMMSEDWTGAQTGNMNKELKDEVIKTALDYHIMTQFTSFVAVEEKKVTTGGSARTIEVPVEMPDGVDRESTLGEADAASFSGGKVLRRAAKPSLMAPSPSFNAPYMASSSPMRSMPPSAYPSKAPSPSPVPMSMPSAGYLSAGRMTMGSAGASLGYGVGAMAPSSPSQHSVRGKLMNRLVQDARSSNEQRKLESLKKDSDKEESKIATNAKMSKLDATLQTLLTSNGKNTSGLEIHNSKVLVKVSLNDVSAEALRKLKSLGFEIVINSLADKSVIGRIRLDKLVELSNLETVLKIEPARSSK